MISRNDTLLLLSDLQAMGIDTREEIKQTMASQTVPLSVLKFIHNSKPLDILAFYEKLRKSYNNKKSKLYINIMRADENLVDDPSSVLTTLSALENQIIQFKTDDKEMFYKFARADEIAKVLSIYFRSYDLDPAIKLLSLVKADIKALETLKW